MTLRPRLHVRGVCRSDATAASAATAAPVPDRRQPPTARRHDVAQSSSRSGENFRPLRRLPSVPLTRPTPPQSLPSPLQRPSRKEVCPHLSPIGHLHVAYAPGLTRTSHAALASHRPGYQSKFVMTRTDNRSVRGRAGPRWFRDRALQCCTSHKRRDWADSRP